MGKTEFIFLNSFHNRRAQGEASPKTLSIQQLLLMGRIADRVFCA
jgi:hypothetical protein